MLRTTFADVRSEAPRSVGAPASAAERESKAWVMEFTAASVTSVGFVPVALTQDQTVVEVFPEM